MHVSHKKIAEFQALVKEHFGKDIPTQEAFAQGLNLAQAYQRLLQKAKERNLGPSGFPRGTDRDL
jgi:hypothetical protein